MSSRSPPPAHSRQMPYNPAVVAGPVPETTLRLHVVRLAAALARIGWLRCLLCSPTAFAPTVASLPLAPSLSGCCWPARSLQLALQIVDEVLDFWLLPPCHCDEFDSRTPCCFEYAACGTQGPSSTNTHTGPYERASEQTLTNLEQNSYIIIIIIIIIMNY